MIDGKKIHCDVCGIHIDLVLFNGKNMFNWFSADDSKHSIDLCPFCTKKYAQTMVKK